MQKLKQIARFFIILRRANLLTSFKINLKTNSENCRPFPFLIYGNSKAVIEKSAKISISSGSFYFNYGFRFNEPFPGLFEMMENSKLSITGNFKICPGAHLIISPNASLVLGSGFINRHSKIKCYQQIRIGNNVTISENVSIWDSDVHEIIREGYIKTAPIEIGDHVWIGTNAIILKGVTIGNNAVIAAGTVVNKNIPSNCLAAGNPMRIISSNVSWKQ